MQRARHNSRGSPIQGMNSLMDGLDRKQGASRDCSQGARSSKDHGSQTMREPSAAPSIFFRFTFQGRKKSPPPSQIAGFVGIPPIKRWNATAVPSGTPPTTHLPIQPRADYAHPESSRQAPLRYQAMAVDFHVPAHSTSSGWYRD